jgi:4,5-dihydroxyphthalate decarboxylase
LKFAPPKGLKIEMIAPGKSLDEMLVQGELPAMISPTIPKSVQRGDGRVARLFPNYKEVELAYFRQTGIFPIMHVTAIKRDIVDAHPWVATNLVKAFEQAKQLAYKRAANPRMVPLAWMRTAWEEERETLGPDPWAYGLGEGNRKNLETIQRYTHQQGLIGKTLPLEELFLDTDLGDAAGAEEEGV